MPGKTPPPGKPLARVLADDPLLAAWERRRRDEAVATRAARRALPRPLAAHVTALLPEPGRLDLVASTGTVAAALRQRLPAVRAAIDGEGMKFREVRVRVQPAPVSPDPVKPVPRQWDSTQKTALSRLASGLPDGPLRDAVSRWLRRSGR
ncbi:hypothetical protein BURK1_00061 [Burkholderiales bacterium]|nr:hypothetical protein BURK1_00061 [Burkholderiales bacterium]